MWTRRQEGKACSAKTRAQLVARCHFNAQGGEGRLLAECLLSGSGWYCHLSIVPLNYRQAATSPASTSKYTKFLLFIAGNKCYEKKSAKPAHYFTRTAKTYSSSALGCHSFADNNQTMLGCMHISIKIFARHVWFVCQCGMHMDNIWEPSCKGSADLIKSRCQFWQPSQCLPRINLPKLNFAAAFKLYAFTDRGLSKI